MRWLASAGMMTLGLVFCSTTLLAGPVAAQPPEPARPSEPAQPSKPASATAADTSNPSKAAAQEDAPVGEAAKPNAAVATDAAEPAAAVAAEPAPKPAEAEMAVPSPDGEEDADDWHRWHLELALFPSLTQQQIEGPNRDDILTNDGGISTAFTFGFAPIKWVEPALWVQFDAGSVRRAIFTRPNDQGVAAEDQVVEGSFWEMWLAFMLRGRLGPGFVEVGWAPLILRNDTTRSDLPNDRGETDGLFEGSRAVAWILGGGATIPVWDNFDITARLQFRIRYLVSRGGEPLADEEENGQMTLWPFVGAHYHF